MSKRLQWHLRTRACSLKVTEGHNKTWSEIRRSLLLKLRGETCPSKTGIIGTTLGAEVRDAAHPLQTHENSSQLNLINFRARISSNLEINLEITSLGTNLKIS